MMGRAADPALSRGGRRAPAVAAPSKGGGGGRASRVPVLGGFPLFTKVYVAPGRGRRAMPSPDTDSEMHIDDHCLGEANDEFGSRLRI